MATYDQGQSRPSRLWRQMPDERRLEAARAFWAGELPEEYRQEAVLAVAQRLNFRPRTVAALAADKKARHLAGTTRLSERLAGHLLVAYHLAAQRPLMQAFLDRLGVSHTDGVIADEGVKVEPEAVRQAALEVASSFPAEDVSLYFATLLAQDPDTWQALEEPLNAAIKGS
jgi:hypothetical protein